MDLAPDEFTVRFHAAREEMLAAWADLNTAAMRAGVDEDTRLALNARFFDGNVAIKKAFWCEAFLALMSRPQGRD